MIWTLRKKLTAISLAGAVTAALVGSIGFTALQKSGAVLDRSQEVNDAVAHLLEMDMMHDALRADVLAALLAEQQDELATIRSDLADHAATFREKFAATAAIELGSEAQAAIESARPALDAYVASAERLVAEAGSDRAQAKLDLPTFVAAFSALEEKNEALADVVGAVATSEKAASAESRASSNALMVVITLAGSLLLLVAGQLLANGIVRPIDRAIGLLEQLAAGKLTARLDHRGSDEIGRLAAAMNATAEGIRAALGADEVDWAAVAKQRSELERVEAMTQNALTPMVYVDTAGIVRAMNPVAGKALRALESTLPKRGWLMSAAAAPMFGAQPEYAAALAAPIHLLPRKLRLEVGETTLDAQVCAIQDSKGELSGRMVSWEDVTQKLATESGVSRTAQSLAAAATQLKAISVRMTDSAGETSKEATRVAGATETVHKNMNTIAASSEEMNSAIREIARSSAEASQIAAQAVEAAKGTNDTVQRLNESSAKIDRVIKVIHDVAEQTNLLALNATIEAARAGEAGKGFAVVANEVKQLAGETGKATKDIESSIVAIQSDVQRAVGEIAAISKVIARIHDIQNSIASAVEEQSATTQEISRNVAEAATRASEIVEGVTTVAKAAETTAQGASETQGAADSLDSLAGELEQQVAATAVAV